MSQELLANALGLTKAYINRTLAALRREGLIRLEDRHLFIPDIERLKARIEEE